MYDRKTGRVTYPSDENGQECHNNGQPPSVRSRNGTSRGSLTGITSLLGHSGRRRTLAEINTDLSNQENQSPNSFDLTRPIEEEEGIDCCENRNYVNRTSSDTSPAPSESNSRRKSTFLSHIGRKLRIHSLGYFKRRLDYNDSGHSLDVERQDESAGDNSQRTSSLRLPVPKHNGILNEQYVNETETSDCESSFSGYGSMSGSYPSSNTISCHISYNDLKHSAESRDSNVSSNIITHF